MGCGDVGEFLAEACERLLIDIADVDLGPIIVKALAMARPIPRLLR
jgi:hypothetical protein